MQRRFAGELNADFRFLPDTARNLAVLYRGANSAGELTVRQSILIDRAGTVRWIDRDVSIFGHGKDVLAKMFEEGMTAPPAILNRNAPAKTP